MRGKHADPFAISHVSVEISEYAKLEDLHFILKGLLVFLPSNQVFDPSLPETRSELDKFVHLSFVFRCQDSGLLHQDLSIVSVCVSPLKVLVWSLLHVHLNVLKRMLLDVSDTQVWVLLDPTNLRYGFSSQKFDQCRLPGTVGADDGGPR